MGVQGDYIISTGQKPWEFPFVIYRSDYPVYHGRTIGRIREK